MHLAQDFTAIISLWGTSPSACEIQVSQVSPDQAVFPPRHNWWLNYYASPLLCLQPAGAPPSPLPAETCVTGRDSKSWTVSEILLIK